MISAEIEPASTNGVIISQGAGAYGYALYLQDGKPAFAVRDQGALTTVLASAWADDQVNAQIPTRIKAASGKKISVDGFMIPLEYKGREVTKFILAMNQNTCCFGGNPQVHEFIIVTAPDDGVADQMDIPLRVTGRLQVGAFRHQGTLSGIYRLNAQSVNYAP